MSIGEPPVEPAAPETDQSTRPGWCYVIIATAVVLTAVVLSRDRPWIGHEERIRRCVDLRYERNQAQVRAGDEAKYSRDGIRAFCKIDAANDNLNHRGGIKRDM